MARKKRIAILVVSIVLVILAIVGTIIFLYLKTDAFKSNETLFAKYFMQSFNAIDTIKNGLKKKEEDIKEHGKGYEAAESVAMHLFQMPHTHRPHK